MPWDFKNNPLLRAVLVIVIGIFAFSLLFSAFTGGGEHMGDMGNMGGAGNAGSISMNTGYGYSLGGLISGLLILLVKILMVLLIVAVLVGVFVWIRNNFFKNANSNFMQSIKNDPLLKTISVVTLAIIGIILVFALLGSFNQTGMGFSGNTSNFSFAMGYNPISSIAGLLTILVKVFMFVLTVSLILAAISYLKTQYDQGNLNIWGTNKNQATSSSDINNTNNQQPTENAGSTTTTE